MNPLHTELLALFGNDADLLQDLANRLDPPQKERRALAVAHSKRLVPKAKPGMQHYRYSFWGQFNEKMVMIWAFCGSEAKQAECAKWLSKQKAKAKAWPPRVMTSVPFTVLPQPRTGRE